MLSIPVRYILRKGSKETGPAHADFVMIKSLSIFLKISFTPRALFGATVNNTISIKCQFRTYRGLNGLSFLVRKVLGLRKLCGQLPYFLHVKINPAVATNTC